MPLRPTDAVSSVIRLVQSALAGVDRAGSADVVRRREAETILSRLADAPVAILIANDRARYVEVNAAATTLTGYTRSELLRMSVWDLTPEPDRTKGMTLWQAFLQQREQSGTYRLRRKDGTLVATTYVATAHVLPSLHLSALTTRTLLATSPAPTKRPVPAKATLPTAPDVRRNPKRTG
jgi:PAS domain S-box-containing protein